MPTDAGDLKGQRALGRAIRTLREEAKLSLKELGELAKFPSASLSRLEDGQIDPAWATVRSIARGLGVSTERLAELSESLEGSPE